VLTYTKEKPFDGGKFNPSSNLKVDVVSSDRYWHYNHPEARNYGAPAVFLNTNKTKTSAF
jgi:hypothetical protein